MAIPKIESTNNKEKASATEIYSNNVNLIHLPIKIEEKRPCTGMCLNITHVFDLFVRRFMFLFLLEEPNAGHKNELQ